MRQNFRGVEIDACAKCAGIFFDEGEVNQIRKQSPQSFEDLDARVQPESAPEAFKGDVVRKCPQCQTLMSQYRYLYSSPIMLDCCSDCGGVWIQNGELKAMAEYVKTCDQETAQTAVARMQASSMSDVHRAKVSERAMRFLSQRIPSSM
jgi:Zn-finger nucleic acid-binding protein